MQTILSVGFLHGIPLTHYTPTRAGRWKEEHLESAGVQVPLEADAGAGLEALGGSVLPAGTGAAQTVAAEHTGAAEEERVE